MPGILTHDAFALRNTPEEEKDLLRVVRIGTQGPDPFMAYGTNPFKKRLDKDEVNPWGGKMHHTHIAEVYPAMMEYASKQDGAIQDVLYAYIDGLLMHYSLDRLVHPYVFYRSGFDENGQYGGIYVFYHGYFESLMDKAVADHEGNPHNGAKTMGGLSKIEAMAISKMWAAACPEKLKEDAFYESYYEYLFVTGMMYSPLGIKRSLLKAIMGKTSKAYSLSAPRSLKKFVSLDVLNETHALWLDPTTKEEHRESIWDLFEQASLDYKVFHEMLLKAKKGEDIRAEMLAFEHERDHDGRIYGQEFQTCHLCFDPETL